MTVLQVDLGARSYAIHIVRGDLQNSGTAIAALNPKARVAVLTDERVDGYYGDEFRQSLQSVSLEHQTLILKRGESNKRPPAILRIWQWLMDQQFDRRNTLIAALGGGIVGDVAGFAAATYMRGVDYVQIPTTLLAQVDSSVGGKTGVNLSGAKNAVGAFHQPRMVFASLQTLRTLTPRDFKAGLAEVIKHGVLGSNAILETIEQNLASVMARDLGTMEALVADCCRLKSLVVQQDERESGLRQVLNFGHSFGHAIEIASKHQLRHGEAVALGMLAACHVSERLGVCESDVRMRLTEILTRVGLKVDLKPYWRSDVVDLMSRDKKLAGATLNFVLVKAIGEVVIQPLTLKELRKMTNASI
jgi:3-dehydroquinate synthase